LRSGALFRGMLAGWAAFVYRHISNSIIWSGMKGWAFHWTMTRQSCRPPLFGDRRAEGR